MLIVHPSSTCDVCLDGFNWATPANAPHAIACGHIFCLGCLRTLNPSNCPMCRKAFTVDRVKKLHVDRYTGGGEDAVVDVEESELLQRVAMFFGENTPDEDVNSVMDEAREWLATRPDTLNSHRALRSAVDALHRYKILQLETRVNRERFDELTRQYERGMSMKDHDLQMAKTVEENLIADNRKIEEAFRTYLAEAEAALTALRNGYGPTHPDVIRYHTYANPLPAPPQPVVPEYPRPYTSQSNHSGPKTASVSAPAGAGRSSTVRARPESLRTDFPEIQDTDDSRRDLSLRPPIMVPGAPSTRKVIPPPLPAEDVSENQRNAWSENRSSVAQIRPDRPASSAPTPADINHASRTDTYPVASSSRTPVGLPFYSNYYDGPHIQRQYPWPSTSAPASTTAEAHPVASGSTSYDHAAGTYTARSRPNELPWAVDTSMNVPVTRETPWHHANDVFADPLSPAPASAPARSDSSSNPTSNTSSVSDASLRSMALLERPTPNGRRSANSSVHREMLGLLGVQHMPSEPSPASTWGTVHSSQASSRHSSLADLGLIGLPGGLPHFTRGPEPPTPAGVVPDSRGPIVEDVVTPRARHISFGRSNITVDPPRGTDGSLGLRLGSEPSTRIAQVVADEQDLEHVSRSLRLFLHQEEPGAAYHHARAPTRQSSQDSGVNGIHVGARTGLILYGGRSSVEESRSEDETATYPSSLSYSRASNVTSHASRRRYGSVSDTESYTPAMTASARVPRMPQEHSHQAPTGQPRHRRVSVNVPATRPEPAPEPSRTPSRRPSLSSRSSGRDPVAAPPMSARSREHRPYEAAARAFATPTNAAPYAADPMNQGSLLLSFGPHAPGGSAAVTSRGEDASSSIHAPRPVSSRHASLGLWNVNSRNAR